jgi:hypothetical protein
MIIVRLRAPLNFDIDKAEPVTLTVRGKKSVSVTLEEESARSDTHVGQVSLSDLGVKAGDEVVCSYGFGYMQSSASLNVK